MVGNVRHNRAVLIYLMWILLYSSTERECELSTNDKVTATDKAHALWQILRRTDHALHRVRQRELEEHGISTEVASTIFTIVRLGPRATTKAIAMQRFLERNTMSETLTRMEKLGVIEKVADPDRKGRVRVILTPRGHEAFAKSVIRLSTKETLSALDHREQKELWLLLARLRDAALDYLGMEAVDVYPPSDPEQLLETVEGRAVADRSHALYQLIRLTERVIYRARQHELGEYGITTEAASALFAIAGLGPQATPKLIAAQRCLERNTASDHLTRLEKRGFVEKVRDLSRKNRIRVVLTAKGQEALARSSIRLSIRNIMSVLDSEDQAELWRLLSMLRAKALEELEMQHIDVYPPSDPEQLSTDTATSSSHSD